MLTRRRRRRPSRRPIFLSASTALFSHHLQAGPLPILPSRALNVIEALAVPIRCSMTNYITICQYRRIKKFVTFTRARSLLFRSDGDTNSNSELPRLGCAARCIYLAISINLPVKRDKDGASSSGNSIFTNNYCARVGV